LYGTITYFTEYIKATIMNNFVVNQPSPMQVCYTEIRNEIVDYAENEEEREMYLANFEVAFNDVYHELFGIRGVD